VTSGDRATPEPSSNLESPCAMGDWCVLCRVAALRAETRSKGRSAMTTPDERRSEQHLEAEEDDGSAEFQPEDGGVAPSPADKPGPLHRG
jgi:hypothetical protein